MNETLGRKMQWGETYIDASLLHQCSGGMGMPKLFRPSVYQD